MPEIRITVSDKEMAVIKEYARQCGERIEDLARKVLVRDATLADSDDALGSEYRVEMKMTLNATRSSQVDEFESNYNRNRRILGLRDLRL